MYKSKPKWFAKQLWPAPGKPPKYIKLSQEHFKEIVKNAAYEHLLKRGLFSSFKEKELETEIQKKDSEGFLHFELFKDRGESKFKIYLGNIVNYHIIMAKIFMVGQQEQIRKKFTKKYSKKIAEFFKEIYTIEFSDNDNESFWKQIRTTIKQSMSWEYNEGEIKNALAQLFSETKTELYDKNIGFSIEIACQSIINSQKNLFNFIGFENNYLHKNFQNELKLALKHGEKLFLTKFKTAVFHLVAFSSGIFFILFSPYLIASYRQNKNILTFLYSFLNSISKEIENKNFSGLLFGLAMLVFVGLYAFMTIYDHREEHKKFVGNELEAHKEKQVIVMNMHKIFGANKRIKLYFLDENGVGQSPVSVLCRDEGKNQNNNIVPVELSQTSRPRLPKQANLFSSSSRKRLQQPGCNLYSLQKKLPIIVKWINNAPYPEYNSHDKEKKVIAVQGKGFPELKVFSYVSDTVKRKLDEYNCSFLFDEKNLSKFAANENQSGVVMRKEEEIDIIKDGKKIIYIRKIKVAGQNASLFGHEAAYGENGEILVEYNLLKLEHKKHKVILLDYTPHSLLPTCHK